MLLKTFVAALLVASTAFAVTANAGPVDKKPGPATEYYMDRASQSHDNGGN